MATIKFPSMGDLVADFDSIRSDIDLKSGLTGQASTTSARSFTADEINTAVAMVTSATPAKAAPTWISSTVTWIEQNKPSYTFGSSSVMPGADRLRHALRRMSYGLLAIQRKHKGESATAQAMFYDRWLSEKLSTWSVDDHNAVREFIKGGGYAAEVDRMKESDHTTDEIDEILKTEAPELSEPPEDEESQSESIARALASLSSPQQDQSIDEVVADQILEEDPRLGAW